jgi:hypothetical protein
MALDRQTDTTQQTQHIPHHLHPAVLTCFFRASSDCDCDDSRSRSRHQRINLTLFHPSSEPCSCRAHLGGSPKLRELDQGHRQRRSNQKTTEACKRRAIRVQGVALVGSLGCIFLAYATIAWAELTPDSLTAHQQFFGRHEREEAS